MIRFIAFLFFISLFDYGYSQAFSTDAPLFSTNSIIKSVESPQWSSDSEKLVFSGYVNGNWNVFIYNVKNDSLFNISDSLVNERMPVWHPDGVNIVYDRMQNGIHKLFICDSRTYENKALIDRDIKCSQASFSKSENLICFLGFDEIKESWQVYTYDFIYDNLNQLTNHKTSCNNPNFSPDGKHILYELISNKLDTTLYMVNWYGNTELVIDTIEAYSPSWDEKSWRFYFLGKDEHSNIEIYSLRRNGESLVQLTNNNLLEKDFILSPNGRYAALIVQKNYNKRLIVVAIK